MPAKKTPPQKTILPIIGIGSSAGGLEALQEFFSSLPIDTGAAFVVVQHLSPSYKSLLSQILGRETVMTVKDITGPERPQANTVYIISPNRNLVFERGRLTPIAILDNRLPKPSVDVFFYSLAENVGPKAIAVILSGTGSDGAAGLRAVRAQGGFTFAQNAKSAKYDGMPLAAINSQAVDWIRTPREIATHISELLAGSNRDRPDKDVRHTGNHINDLLQLLYKEVQIDFEGYKRSTVMRRIERRMIAVEQHSTTHYLSYCQKHPEELRQLARDMLISVTQFFRDPMAFDALGETLDQRFKEANGHLLLRAWVAACATGEEAYSIAMLLEEKAREHSTILNYKVFATDIDEAALDIAKRGLYSVTALKDIKAKYRNSYFTLRGDQYQINKSIRQNVVFSRHNIITDPPFSRLDIISCRNFLIYLSGTLQINVLRKLHYVLIPKGLLLLGKSETILKEDGLFDAVNKWAKLYQRRRPAKNLTSFSVLGSGSTFPQPYRSSVRTQAAEPTTKTLCQEFLADCYGPPSLILDDRYNVIYSHGEIVDFVRFPRGEIHLALKNILPDIWYNEAQALLYQATSRKKIARGVEHPFRKQSRNGLLMLSARASFDNDERLQLLLLSFDWRPVNQEIIQDVDNHDDLSELQYQLEISREHLESVMEEHNTTVEEMNALNEELQAANEELQSSNEELESSTEELQSTNEELITVNEELLQKNAEAETLSGYLSSIQDSIPVALLVVGKQLQLQRYNKASVRMFQLDENHIGQSLANLPLNIGIERLLTLLQKVLGSNKPQSFAREIVNDGRRFYQVSVDGLRRKAQEIDGAIITLLDISDQHLAEMRAERSEKNLLSMMNHSPALTCQKDLAGRYTFVNDSFTHFFSVSRHQCLGKTDEQLFDKILAEHLRHEDVEAHKHHDRSKVKEEKIKFKDKEHWFLSIRFPLLSEDGVIDSIVWKAIDITDKKHMELEAEKARNELNLQYHLRDSLLNQRADFVAALDHDFRFLMVTPSYADIMQQLYGITCQEGNSLSDLLVNRPADWLWQKGIWNRALGGERFTDTFEYQSATNETRYLKYEMIPVRHGDGSTLGAAIFARDITARKRAEEALKYTDQVYRSLIEKTDTGYVTLDLNCMVLDANPEYLRLSGHARLEEIKDRSPLEWTHPEDAELHEIELKRVLARADMKNLQLRFVDTLGRITPVESNATMLKTLKGHQINIWCKDIKQRVEQQHRIEQLAYYDPLTGLENRVMLKQLLKKAILRSDRHQERLAVMFVDLDRFKHINDSLGHETGDEVLKLVAERLKTSVRSTDVVGRLGGDEFLCVVSELSHVEHDSIRIAQKLLQTLSQPYRVGDHVLHLSASIGISIYPDNGEDASTLIKNADAAMYQIKENGRDDYVFYSPAMNDRSHAFVAMANKLRSAFADGQLRLHFQPQYRLSSGDLIAAEALLRWHHPEQGLISPAMFIPVAEDIGLMKALGRWILEKTCAQLKQWQSSNLPIVPISINVSARQCREKWVEEEVLHCLKKYGVDPKYLQLEFTESSLISNSDEAQGMLRDLKSMGIHIAIDDFGTGYSSLSYLKQFPIDKLKIDKSFILDIGRDEGDETIVAAIIGLAKNLKMSVLAEGVETEEQLTFLKNLNCDEAQGFYYHEALDSDSFLQLLSQDNESMQQK